jgi:endonuclease YncB( thermonuclease family)
MRPNLLLPLFALAFSCPGFGATQHTLVVKVTKINDGDTIQAIDSNHLEHRIRLLGIDAPEDGQAFGNRSTQNLSRLVSGKEVRIEWSKEDKYGRFLAIVRLPAPDACDPPMCRDGQLDINLTQVVDGMAWHYKQYEKDQTQGDRRVYASAEQSARVSSTGLWSDPDPVPPWDFRVGLKNGPVKKSRNDICHDQSMSTYSSVKNFESFATLEECIDSGGRLPRNVSR